MRFLVLTALDIEQRHLFPNGVEADYELHATGVGKVNAAMAAASLLRVPGDFYGAVLNVGVAGAVSHSDLLIGDVVIPREIIQHDMNAEPLAPVGCTPYQDNPPLGPPDFEPPRFNGWSVMTNCGLATGDTFVSGQAERDRIAQFNVHAVDMEGYAVAYVANTYGVPCMCIKGISDIAGEGSGGFAEAVGLAMGHVSEVAQYVMENWESWKHRRSFVANKGETGVEKAVEETERYENSVDEI